MSVLHIYMAMHHVCAMAMEARKGTKGPGIRYTDCCETPCGCSESNLSSLEEPPMFP